MSDCWLAWPGKGPLLLSIGRPSLAQALSWRPQETPGSTCLSTAALAAADGSDGRSAERAGPHPEDHLPDQSSGRLELGFCILGSSSSHRLLHLEHRCQGG